jgi:hypothetical protein
MTVKEVLLDDFELCLDYFPEGNKKPDWEECESIMYPVSPEEVDEFMESVVDQLYACDLDELAEEVGSLDGTREEVMDLLSRRPKPLAFYFFSEDQARIEAATSRCAFGGGCVNDVIIHLATSEMGFGGVGESGMGSYHGKEGFEAFSHRKSIVDKKTWMDLPMRYQPYRGLYEKALRLFLR